MWPLVCQEVCLFLPLSEIREVFLSKPSWYDTIPAWYGTIPYHSMDRENMKGMVLYHTIRYYCTIAYTSTILTKTHKSLNTNHHGTLDQRNHSIQDCLETGRRGHLRPRQIRHDMVDEHRVPTPREGQPKLS